MSVGQKRTPISLTKAFVQANVTLESELQDFAGAHHGVSGQCGVPELAYQRRRFLEKSIRQCDKISSVWSRYNHRVDGSSIRDVHLAHEDAWTSKSNWTDKNGYQAWLKWASIVERILLYASALQHVNPTLEQDEAERLAVQVLEIQQQISGKKSLTRFREDVLTKQAMGDWRMKDLTQAGYELVAICNQMQTSIMI